MPHGESLQSFCVRNKVPYNIFQKWFKDTRKKVVAVRVDGVSVITYEEKTGLVTNLPLHQKAVMSPLIVFGLRFVSAMGCVYP